MVPAGEELNFIFEAAGYNAELCRRFVRSYASALDCKVFRA